MNDFAALDGLAQAELVRKREVLPIELVEAAIERVLRVNPELNAVVTPMYDLAREAARGELPEGPFRGVPFLLKDLIASFAGVPLTGGATACARYVPDHDSELVLRYKRAGLVVIGKTNTSEFGIAPTTENRLFGATRNPWDPTRSPGGSSGGSAVAVAARMVPMAHGGDSGGSLRIAASACGAFGLKPTRARTSLAPEGDLMSGLVCQHAITRSVRDSAALLDATAGARDGDPYSAPPPVRSYLAETESPPARLRLAFSSRTATGVSVDSDCVTAVEDAARLCESLGHDVDENAPEYDGFAVLRSLGVLVASGAARNVADVAAENGGSVGREMFEPLTWGLHEMAASLRTADYLLAVRNLQRTARDVARFFRRYDAWITPALAQPPLPIGAFEASYDNPLLGFIRASDWTPFTPLLNATGQPAMSVPLHWNANGLPIGVQFVGRFGDEATLFRLAAQLERACPWADRKPPISA